LIANGRQLAPAHDLNAPALEAASAAVDQGNWPGAAGCRVPLPGLEAADHVAGQGLTALDFHTRQGSAVFEQEVDFGADVVAPKVERAHVAAMRPVLDRFHDHPVFEQGAAQRMCVDHFG
jgi:uncharacterized protein (UPF0548 family)